MGLTATSQLAPSLLIAARGGLHGILANRGRLLASL